MPFEIELDSNRVALVRSGLRKLGPERCQSALAAFEKLVPNWEGCLLARAYGPSGALRKAVELEAGQPNCVVLRSDVCELLGLGDAEVLALIEVYERERFWPWLRKEIEAVAALAFGCSRLNHSEILT